MKNIIKRILNFDFFPLCFAYTVKPVLRGHIWDKAKVVF